MAGRPEYDVAIVGGGLAGLSLAVRLAGTACRAIVIEPRPAYRRDRTWSYWRLLAHPFEAAVAARWTSWEVMRAGEARAVQSSADLPYEMIPADRLYRAATSAIRAAPNLRLALGTSVRSLAEEPDRVRLETDAGPIEAAYAFDSRPPPPGPGDLVQRFLGQEVVTERPVFDSCRITLMDFAVRQQPGAVRFLYVLPTSPTEALVEDTWLAPADAVLPDHRDAVRAYLAERYGTTSYRVAFEEEGAIPMSPGLQGEGSTGRVIAIGTAGGAVKPSSGYGFLGIQRMTSALAADLAAERPPRPFRPRSPAARWMDAVFLHALQRAPERAPLVFQSMFAGCPPDPLIRFLNDMGSPADAARVMLAMPKLTMIAAAGSHSRRAGAIS